MIEFRQVGFAYPGADAAARPALASLDVAVSAGELLVVLGPNGSGKSTLALLANGLLLPESGEVVVDGMSTADPATVLEIRSRVGAVFQDPDNQIVGTIVEEDVAFGPENLGVPQAEIRERVDRALGLVGLTGLERREPHTLSGGQKQRLAIAGALALEPAYLVLDEPTALLDPLGRSDVLAIIASLREQGRGIIHITHRIEDAAAADRVLILGAGRTVFDGSPDLLFSMEGGPSALGVSVPPIRLLAQELSRLGFPVPARAVSSEDLAEALWL